MPHDKIRIDQAIVNGQLVDVDDFSKIAQQREERSRSHEVIEKYGDALKNATSRFDRNAFDSILNNIAKKEQIKETGSVFAPVSLGAIEIFEPTCQYGFVLPSFAETYLTGNKEKRLVQAWICKMNGKVEWRELPVLPDTIKALQPYPLINIG